MSSSEFLASACPNNKIVATAQRNVWQDILHRTAGGAPCTCRGPHQPAEFRLFATIFYKVGDKIEPLAFSGCLSTGLVATEIPVHAAH
jgi:hypothetical protein